MTSRTVRKVPVLAPAQIANLPAGRVLVIRRGLAPVIGRARMAWRRRDVRIRAVTCQHPEQAARVRTAAERLGRWRDDVTARAHAAHVGLLGRLRAARDAAQAERARLTSGSRLRAAADRDMPEVEAEVIELHPHTHGRDGVGGDGGWTA